MLDNHYIIEIITEIDGDLVLYQVIKPSRGKTAEYNDKARTGAI